jgi:cytoskeletal protein RodZ
MSKLGDAFKDGRIVAGAVVLGLTGVLGVGVVTVANANPEPAAVVETADPAMTIDLTETTDNGLATEQEAEAAAAEAARIEAERVAAEAAAAAEAARVAAEQEAARIAAEQAAAYEESYEEPTYSEPDPAPPADYCPDGYIDDPTKGCHSPICAVLADGTEVPCAP